MNKIDIKVPESLFFKVCDTENELMEWVDKQDNLKEAFFAAITSGSETTPDLYQFSTRTTNDDNLIKGKYNKYDTIKQLAFIESVWGYVGWVWEDFTYEDRVLQGGHFTNFKSTTVISHIDDGKRLYHINDFLKAIPNNVTIEGFNTNNIVCANNANLGKATSADVSLFNWLNLESADSMGMPQNITGTDESLVVFNAPKLKTATSGGFRFQTNDGSKGIRYNFPNLQSSRKAFEHSYINLTKDFNSDLYEETTSESGQNIALFHLDRLFVSKFNYNTALYDMFSSGGFTLPSTIKKVSILIDCDKLFNTVDGDISVYLAFRGHHTIKSSQYEDIMIKSRNNNISLKYCVFSSVNRLIIDEETLPKVTSFSRLSYGSVAVAHLPFNQRMLNDTNMYSYFNLTSVPDEEAYFDFSPDNTEQEIADQLAYATVGSNFRFINLSKCKVVDLSYLTIKKSTSETEAVFNDIVVEEGVTDHTVHIEDITFDRFKYGFTSYYEGDLKDYKTLNFAVDLSNLTLNFLAIMTNNVYYFDGCTKLVKTPKINIHVTQAPNQGYVTVFRSSKLIENIDISFTREETDTSGRSVLAYLEIDARNATNLHTVNITGNIAKLYLNYCKDVDIDSLSASLLQHDGKKFKGTLYLWYKVYDKLSEEVKNHLTTAFTTTLINA